MSKEGILFIVSAPAGTGKTTLVSMLTNEFKNTERSISCTTREARNTEREGVDYFFLSPADFEKQKRDFLEYAEVFGHYYGTKKSIVEAALHEGKNIVLIIDTQGALSVMEKMDSVSIFILPPSLEELEKRLRARKTDSEKSIETRLSWAKKEMEMAIHYDYHITNENLLNAYDVLRSILLAEEHRVK